MPFLANCSRRRDVLQLRIWHFGRRDGVGGENIAARCASHSMAVHLSIQARLCKRRVRKLRSRGPVGDYSGKMPPCPASGFLSPARRKSWWRRDSVPHVVAITLRLTWNYTDDIAVVCFLCNQLDFSFSRINHVASVTYTRGAVREVFTVTPAAKASTLGGPLRIVVFGTLGDGQNEFSFFSIRGNVTAASCTLLKQSRRTACCLSTFVESCQCILTLVSLVRRNAHDGQG